MDFVIPTYCLFAMLVGAGLGGVLTVFGIPFLLGLFGFTAAGVSAGSLAAMWQGTMGGAVGAGSLFALLQSIAASGFGLLSTVAVSGATGSLAYAFCTKVDCSLGYQSGAVCEGQ